MAAALMLGSLTGATQVAAQVQTPAMPWDINGDGFAEFVTGAYTEDLSAISDAGVFHVLDGSSTGVTATGSQLYHQNTAGVPDTAQSDDLLGFSQASGDFNADGFADLAVGAPGEDLNAVRDSGLVNVFYGSAAGLSTVNARTYSLSNTAYGARTDAFFGFQVVAGDFDDDGDSDLAIGASGFGRVFVVKGSPSGLGTFLSVFGQNTTGVPGTHSSIDQFGSALAAGDANGDGRDDLAIGAIFDFEDRGFSSGSVTMLYGTASGLSGTGAQRWSKDSPGIGGNPASFGNNDLSDSFGLQVALADFDGDGFADLAASAPGAPVTFSGVKAQDAGTINFIYGSVGGLTSSGSEHVTQATAGFPGNPATEDLMGFTLVGGDADGDGKAELAIFTPREESVIVVNGVLRTDPITGFAWTQNTPGIHGTTEAGDGFGGSLRFSSLNGDAFADLAVGVPGEDNAEGAAEIIYGSASGLTATGAQQFTQDTPGVPDVAQAGDQFGSFF